MVLVAGDADLVLCLAVCCLRVPFHAVLRQDCIDKRFENVLGAVNVDSYRGALLVRLVPILVDYDILRHFYADR